MRRKELKTISTAHQAYLLSEHIASGKSLCLNSDSTTKCQKKLNATAFSGVVLSVTEIPDGKAQSVMCDIDNQFQKLRKIAQQLEIPNYEMLNWTMLCASSSDSASTQKRLNKLIQERKEDEKLYAIAGEESIDIIRNFCAMHLAINLRKAFLKQVINEGATDSAVDNFVYEFCKLFGTHGSPEYAIGMQFHDFLTH